ncbi:hypothetical protein L227DRAFT_578971 [Lentinus tigrinus ALCF2SS1-6]|uniref:Uncharacterized protein n=1 Tax=Lentinus tigrinus ALCF2SS1-6 TaxID=1328759 RepID=A0A5C2RYX9_9APHY|nr:hypothetical protein L227DRAFT_578971 [Lentinus tigrinus ALCF2SS1-6]
MRAYLATPSVAGYNVNLRLGLDTQAEDMTRSWQRCRATVATRHACEVLEEFLLTWARCSGFAGRSSPYSCTAKYLTQRPPNMFLPPPHFPKCASRYFGSERTTARVGEDGHLHRRGITSPAGADVRSVPSYRVDTSVDYLRSRGRAPWNSNTQLEKQVA